jgi:hypothetical protein
MQHPIYHVVDFEIVAPYVLHIQFDDGSNQTINFEPVLRGELFGPLRDINIFNKVRLDPEVKTIVWPNDADFDPADLHNWPEVAQGFIERATRWELSK